MVNLASRIQGAAEPGEILVSDEVYKQVAGAAPDAGQREYQLKGIEGSVSLHALHA